MRHFVRDDRIAKLFDESSIPCGPFPPKLELASFIQPNGTVMLTWDTPHAGGYTSRYLKVRHEDIPELVELLMGVYNQKQQEGVVREVTQLRRV